MRLPYTLQRGSLVVSPSSLECTDDVEFDLSKPHRETSPGAEPPNFSSPTRARLHSWEKKTVPGRMHYLHWTVAPLQAHYHSCYRTCTIIIWPLKPTLLQLKHDVLLLFQPSTDRFYAHSQRVTKGYRFIERYSDPLLGHKALRLQDGQFHR